MAAAGGKYVFFPYGNGLYTKDVSLMSPHYGAEAVMDAHLIRKNGLLIVVGKTVTFAPRTL